MATAPKPGSTPNSRRKRAERQGIVITIDGVTHTLYVADLGPEDYRLVRKEAKVPVSSFLTEDGFDYDSVEVMWWLARRKEGERSLRLGQVDKEFPSPTEFGAMVEDDRITIESLDADDDEGDDTENPLP